MAKFRGQSLPPAQEAFYRVQQDKAKGFHPVVLRSASFQGRGFQEVNVPKTEYRQRLHGWTTEEMAGARGKSIDIEERRMLQQAMHRKAVEQVKRRAAEARARQMRSTEVVRNQVSASSLQRDKVPALDLHVVGLPVDFATKKSAQRDKGPPAKVNSQPIPSSRAASVGKTLPTKWGTKNAPSAASTRTPSEAGSRPSTSSSYKVQKEVASPMPKQVAANTVAVQKQVEQLNQQVTSDTAAVQKQVEQLNQQVAQLQNQVAANTVAVQKQVEQLNQQVMEAVPVEALSKTSEERPKDGGASVRPEMVAAVPLKGRIPPKLQRMQNRAGKPPNPESAYEAKVGRAFIKALKAWWEQQQAERVPLPKPTSGQTLPRKVRAASMGALQGNATQASHSASDQWGSKASRKNDRRVRGAKYMPRPVSDGRIRDP